MALPVISNSTRGYDSGNIPLLRVYRKLRVILLTSQTFYDSFQADKHPQIRRRRMEKLAGPAKPRTAEGSTNPSPATTPTPAPTPRAPAVEAVVPEAPKPKINIRSSTAAAENPFAGLVNTSASVRTASGGQKRPNAESSTQDIMKKRKIVAGDEDIQSMLSRVLDFLVFGVTACSTLGGATYMV